MQLNIRRITFTNYHKGNMLT